MIIGIAGHIGVGKDTFGLALQERMGAYLTSFAEPIRNLSAYLGFNWTDRERKEREQLRNFACIDESIQKGIEFCLGHWEDNDKAVLYAFLVEDLRPHIVRGSHAFESDSILISPRALMQIIGSAGRKVRNSIWIDEVVSISKRHPCVIVTDVRFPEEAEVCDELLYIIREGYGRRSDHVSEGHHVMLIMEATQIILNHGPVTNLIQAAEAEARRING